MFWAHWSTKTLVIPQHALLHRSISVTLLTRGNSRQRYGRKAGCTTVGRQWMTKTGLCGPVGKLSGVLGLFLGRSVGLCSPGALWCQYSMLTMAGLPCLLWGSWFVTLFWSWPPASTYSLCCLSLDRRYVCCGCRLTTGWCLQACQIK